RSSVRRRVTGPDQPATSAATVAATLTAPSGSISRPMRGGYDANQTWKSVGEGLFQKTTNATPMTSMPPGSRPSAKQASIINAVAIAVSSAAHQPKREPGTHPLEQRQVNPDQGERLEQARFRQRADVVGLKAELDGELRRNLLGRRVVAAVEHHRAALAIFRILHVRVTRRVEDLDDARARGPRGNMFVARTCLADSD